MPLSFEEFQKLRDSAKDRPLSLSLAQWQPRSFPESMLDLHDTERSEYAHTLIEIYKGILTKEELNNAPCTDQKSKKRK